MKIWFIEVLEVTEVTLEVIVTKKFGMRFRSFALIDWNRQTLNRILSSQKEIGNKKNTFCLISFFLFRNDDHLKAIHLEDHFVVEIGSLKHLILTRAVLFGFKLNRKNKSNCLSGLAPSWKISEMFKKIALF